MKHKRTIVATMAMLVFFGSAFTLQQRMLRRLRENPEIYRDTLYVPSAEYVKWVTLGYDQLAADLLWLRAIQTFGATYANKENLPPLVNYFYAISDLDPQFVPVYSFANMVLGEEAGDDKLGLDVIDRGIRNNPRYYRIPFEGAFFSLWNLNDIPKAKYYIHIAGKDPNCPAWVRGWEAYLEVKQGRHLAAYQKYLSDYMNLMNAKDYQMATIRRLNLRRVIRDWQKSELRRLAIEFEAKNGRFPQHLAELEATGALAELEAPDWERLRQALEAIESQGIPYPATSEERNATSIRFIRKGWPQIPPDPASDNPYFRSYLIWPGQSPHKFNDRLGKTEDNPQFVVGEAEAAKFIQEHFQLTEELVQKTMQQQGLTECPARIDEILPNNFTQRYQEPWGGHFIWDPATCKFKSSTHPNLRQELLSAPMI